MEYDDFMNSFVVRDDVFNDITYLQKHLRLLVKIHQKLSSKLYLKIVDSEKSSFGTKVNVKVSKHFYTIRKFMDELEDEMEAISNEQKILTDILKSCVSEYLEMLWKESKIKVEIDVANGYISRALQFYYQKHHLNVIPINVKLRKSKELTVRCRQIHRQCASESARVKQLNQQNIKESLLTPKFQKPSTSSFSNNSKARPDLKSYPSKKSKVIGAQHAKIIYKKQNDVNGKQNNLLKALNNVKIDQLDGKPAYPVNFDAAMMNTCEFNRSDGDYSEHSSYDGIIHSDPNTRSKRHSPVSSSSSESGFILHKLFPPLPLELPPKTEYNQVEFLELFKLITLQAAEDLKKHPPTRKSRRKCVKNEKSNFHYGEFDLNEAAIRVRINRNKKSIFYSPCNNS